MTVVNNNSFGFFFFKIESGHTHKMTLNTGRQADFDNLVSN